jgi:UDP-N-acetylmuramoylalanine--D-glutamate ligase
VSTPVPAGEQAELAALRLIARRLGVDDAVRLLSPWTPLCADEVREPAALSGAGDLLLRYSPIAVLGVTGSAGKTTTARLAEAMLRASGIEPLASSDAPADNAWPTAELLQRVLAAAPPAVCVAELTSNHLAVCSASPQIACITNVWADHIDQHGSLEAYLEAKTRIVAFQEPGDWAVVNAADPGAVALTAGCPGRSLPCTLDEPEGHTGAGVRSGRLTVRLDGREFDLGPAAALPPAPGREAGLLAGASALLAGASPDAIARALADWTGLALRREQIGIVDGSPVIRDALAATPVKAAAGLALHEPGSVVLIAGGHDDLGGGPMHSSPEEREQFERAAAVAARVCVHAALFGPAGPRLADALSRAGLAGLAVHAELVAACADARAHAGSGRALVFAPWFPTTPAERAAIPGLLGL